MRRLRLEILIPLILLILIPASVAVYLKYFSQKTKEETNQQQNYDTESVYKAFIEEEEYIPEENNTSNTQTKLAEVSGWIAYWDFANGVKTYKSNSSQINSLSPTWYFVKPDGTLGLRNTAKDSKLMQLCQNNQTKLIPTIVNSNASELSKILNDQTLLDKHITAIQNEVIANNYDGIDIDYELIQANDRDAFSNFIKLLAEKLHSQNKILTIAILWKNDLDSVIEEVSESRSAQDWQALSQYVDEMRIMAYDYTHSDNVDGPIAPYEWIQGILDYAVKNIPLEKIALGLPLYAYEWTEGQKGAKALVWEDVQFTMNNVQLSIIQNKLDEQFVEKKLTFTKNSSNKIIWYQDAEVTKKRIELAQQYKVNKIIFWRLGGEDPEIFKILKN